MPRSFYPLNCKPSSRFSKDNLPHAGRSAFKSLLLCVSSHPCVGCQEHFFSCKHHSIIERVAMNRHRLKGQALRGSAAGGASAGYCVWGISDLDRTGGWDATPWWCSRSPTAATATTRGRLWTASGPGRRLFTLPTRTCTPSTYQHPPNHRNWSDLRLDPPMPAV